MGPPLAAETRLMSQQIRKDNPMIDDFDDVLPTDLPPVKLEGEE